MVMEFVAPSRTREQDNPKSGNQQDSEILDRSKTDPKQAIITGGLLAHGIAERGSSASRRLWRPAWNLDVTGVYAAATLFGAKISFLQAPKTSSPFIFTSIAL